MHRAEYKLNKNKTESSQFFWREAVAAHERAEVNAKADELICRIVALDSASEKELELCYVAIEAQQARTAIRQHMDELKALAVTERLVWPLDFANCLEILDVDFAHIRRIKEYDFHVEEQKAGIKQEVLFVEAEGAAHTYHRLALEVARRDAPFRFLDLPAEIRREIYKYSLKDVAGLKCDQVRNRSGPVKATPFHFRGIFNRALLKTCRHIRSEAIPFALASNVIEFHNWEQAMLVIRHYRLQEHRRAYSIRVWEKLHPFSPYYGEPPADATVESGYDSEDDPGHEFQLVPIMEFCEQYPLINVQLTIFNICPWDLLEIEGHEPIHGWYNFLVDWWRRHPKSSLKLTFSPHEKSWRMVKCHRRYPEVKRKLRVFGEGAMRDRHAGWQEIGMSADK